MGFGVWGLVGEFVLRFDRRVPTGIWCVSSYWGLVGGYLIVSHERLDLDGQLDGARLPLFRRPPPRLVVRVEGSGVRVQG